MKMGNSLVRNAKQGANEVLGTCVSLGITVDGKDAKAVIAEVKKGEHESAFAA
jgi:large subunit ribosomal protein L11